MPAFSTVTVRRAWSPKISLLAQTNTADTSQRETCRTTAPHHHLELPTRSSPGSPFLLTSSKNGERHPTTRLPRIPEYPDLADGHINNEAGGSGHLVSCNGQGDELGGLRNSPAIPLHRRHTIARLLVSGSLYHAPLPLFRGRSPIRKQGAVNACGSRRCQVRRRQADGMSAPSSGGRAVRQLLSMPMPMPAAKTGRYSGSRARGGGYQPILPTPELVESRGGRSCGSPQLPEVTPRRGQPRLHPSSLMRGTRQLSIPQLGRHTTTGGFSKLHRCPSSAEKDDLPMVRRGFPASGLERAGPVWWQTPGTSRARAYSALVRTSRDQWGRELG